MAVGAVLMRLWNRVGMGIGVDDRRTMEVEVLDYRALDALHVTAIAWLLV